MSIELASRRPEGRVFSSADLNCMKIICKQYTNHKNMASQRCPLNWLLCKKESAILSAVFHLQKS